MKSHLVWCAMQKKSVAGLLSPCSLEGNKILFKTPFLKRITGFSFATRFTCNIDSTGSNVLNTSTYFLLFCLQFVVKKGRVLTPHADYCLPGITRATVSCVYSFCCFKTNICICCSIYVGKEVSDDTWIPVSAIRKAFIEHLILFTREPLCWQRITF